MKLSETKVYGRPISDFLLPDQIELLQKQIDSPSTSDTEEQDKLYLNMQYYMEYCQRNEYVTPKNWLEKHKHF